MVHENKEIEIKIRINDLKKFENKVLALDPEIINEVFQRTIRFDTNNHDLEEKGVFVRLRSGFKNTWTVKKKLEKVSQEHKYFQRNEWEVEVSDLKTARQMLVALGFDKEFIMEKYRKKFILPSAEITIDRLPFGIFAEIEASKDEIDRLTRLLDIDYSQRITVTYWDIHREYNINHHLSEENIVF